MSNEADNGYKWVSKFNIGDVVRHRLGDISDKFIILHVRFGEKGAVVYQWGEPGGDTKHFCELELIKVKG